MDILEMVGSSIKRKMRKEMKLANTAANALSSLTAAAARDPSVQTTTLTADASTEVMRDPAAAVEATS